MNSKVVFNKQQLDFIKTCFPDKVLDSTDPCIVTKLLIREGERKVIDLVQRHIPMDQL